ncbi:MAG: ATP-binding cassette domain-containing protein, partial [Halieaceae bacterium]
MTALLKLTDVSVQFSTDADPYYTVFREVNLSIHAGERVAVVGRNGSGKSTLLRVMARIFAPTSGQVEWADG